MQDYRLFAAIAAAPVDPVVRFYQHLWDCDPDPWLADRYAEFQLPGLRLAIFRPTAAHAAEFQLSPGLPSGSGGLSLCVTVPDLAVAIARVAALSDRPVGTIITAAHGRECYVYDPAGTRLILYEPA